MWLGYDLAECVNVREALAAQGIACKTKAKSVQNRLANSAVFGGNSAVLPPADMQTLTGYRIYVKKSRLPEAKAAL